MKRKWDLSVEDNKKCINDVIARIEEIDSDNVGIIAAQDIIDIVAQCVGPKAYNSGAADVKKLLQERMQDIEVDIEMLQQS